MTGIHFGKSMLPDNASRWDRAVSLTSADCRGIDADAIRRAFDPWTCPPNLLPWLAQAFSLDFWDDSWSVTRQRGVVARAIELHFAKGTEFGYREYAALGDATVTKITVPPQRVFSGPSLTRAEREAWLANLPQVRVWKINEPGERPRRKMFSGGLHHDSFLKGRFTMPSTALSRLRRRARWVVDGVETDNKVTDNGNWFRVHVKAPGERRVFCNRVKAKRFFMLSTAYKRLVSIEPATVAQPWRSSVRPQLEPVVTEPDTVRVTAPAGKRVFSGRVMGAGHFFLPSYAPFQVFLRFAVHDGRPVVRRPACQFMGVGRYGWPAHTAALQLSMEKKLGARQAGEGVFSPGTTFWLPHDPTRTRKAKRAIIAGKRASDRILMAYTERPKIIAGQPFLAGVQDFVIGRPAKR